MVAAVYVVFFSLHFVCVANYGSLTKWLLLQVVEILVMHISVCLFSEVVLECKYNGQLPLSDAPAGTTHSTLVVFYHLRLSIYFNGHNSTQVYLREKSGQ